MPLPSWTNREDMQLIALIEQGLSARAIAAEMGTKTRNAVLGRIHRLRKEMDKPLLVGDITCKYTKGRHEAIERKAAGLPRKTAKSGWERWRGRNREETRAAKPRAKIKAKLRMEAREMSHGGIVCCESPKLIWDLDWFDCRWIVTHDTPASETFYCSNLKAPGCAYCAAHQAMATDNRVPGVYVPLQKFNTSWRAA